MSLAVKFTNRQYWWDDRKMLECQDTFTLQEVFDQMWAGLSAGMPIKVVVTLSDLVSDNERTFSFFENPKRIKLSHTMDALNQRFGKNTIYLGSVSEVLDSAPTRIAFSSIPDMEI